MEDVVVVVARISSTKNTRNNPSRYDNNDGNTSSKRISISSTMKQIWRQRTTNNKSNFICSYKEI